MAEQLLGDILIEAKEITDEQLNEALDIQKKEGGLIGIILVNLGYISEASLVKYLAIRAEKLVNS